MAGGRLWGTLFFLFMTFASFSTVIAVFENIIACACEDFGWDRHKACIVGGGAGAAGSALCAGLQCVSFIQPMGAGSTVLDFEDFLVSNLLLPGGSLVYLLFCVTKWGWGFDKYAAECNTGDGPKMPRWVKPYFKYAAGADRGDFGARARLKDWRQPAEGSFLWQQKKAGKENCRCCDAADPRLGR